MTESNPIEFFKSFGFDQRRAEETAKNSSLTKNLISILKEAQKSKLDLKDDLNLLYTTATNLYPEGEPHQSLVIEYILNKKINKNNILPATAYLKKVGSNSLDKGKFEEECGIGVVVSKAQIEKTVSEAIDKVKANLLKERYNYSLTNLLASLRQNLKGVDGKELKDEVDNQIKKLLGERTEQDNQKPVKKKEAPKPTETKSNKTSNDESVKELTIRFPDPKENTQLTPKILEEHLKATKGVVVCRFPPEPNGYLHIGHAKSMNLNFTYPKKSGGYTYLRFDDTNPEAEKLEYIDSIIEDVKWMSHTPYKITFSSDYFPQLYEWAIQLIKEGNAYVDHQTPEEIAEFREKKMDSPYRNRPIEESLKLFEDMRKGKFEEGKATLRLKMDMQSDNTVMRDLIAYRIKYTPHPHVGDKWCIYPSYDYTHCLIDSIENITHSLCTLEFGVRRESYYWLIDALRIYRPLVWEYSRLNITNTVISKRKLIKLVKEGHVKGWDDPRMPTIRGLRRRGYTPEAINDFCDRIGITRNENLISIQLLEQCVREDLDLKVNRAMVVSKPLKVTVMNWTGEPFRNVTVQNHPKDPSKGVHTVPFSKVFYIEQTDFREQDVKGYKRLAPGKEVGLLHIGIIIVCKDYVVKDGQVVELKVEANFNPKNPAKGYIHWVAEPAPGRRPDVVEIHNYNVLFNSPEPGNLENWLEDLNPNSLEVVEGCFADPSIKNVPVGSRFQFERVGYFILDPDTTPQKQVWNRIVSLKETKWEN